LASTELLAVRGKDPSESARTRLDDLEMLRLRWRAQLTRSPGLAFIKRISERRAPADVTAVEVHLVDADDRDDVFEAGGVL